MTEFAATLISSAMATEYIVRHLADRAEWERWLEDNHESEPGIWLRLAKKDGELTSVSRAEALDVALCFGWIDGQAKRFDEHSWLQKFTPRGKRSVWSQVNQEHVARLIAEERMRPGGVAAVEAAKVDGRWERAYPPASTATVPDDLQAALDRNPEARDFFAALKGANRYAILHRLATAVKPETRARRMEKFIGMLERGETLH